MMLITFLLLGINTVIFLADGMSAGMLIFNYLKYIVATFISFNIPLIGGNMVFPVYGQTKIMGIDYSY